MYVVGLVGCDPLVGLISLALLGSSYGCGRVADDVHGAPDGTPAEDASVPDAATDDAPTDETATAGIPFDPEFDVVADFTQACERECANAEPEPEGICETRETLETLATCREMCLETITNVDAACATCLVQSLVWDASERWCNDFE